jgi:hypothetical protein
MVGEYRELAKLRAEVERYGAARPHPMDAAPPPPKRVMDEPPSRDAAWAEFVTLLREYGTAAGFLERGLDIVNATTYVRGGTLTTREKLEAAIFEIYKGAGAGCIDEAMEGFQTFGDAAQAFFGSITLARQTRASYQKMCLAQRT